MPNRSEIQAFLRSIDCEAAASDQAQLCLVEKVVEALGEVTEGMAEAGADAILDHDQDERPSQIAWAVFRAMFSARFRGE